MNSVNAAKSYTLHVRLVKLLLYVIVLFALLDYFVRFTFFKSDPATEEARLNAVLVFVGVYLFSALLFTLNYFWAKWFTFAFSLFMFIMTLLFYTSSFNYIDGAAEFRILLEILIRFGVLIILIISIVWEKKYKLEKNKL